MALPLELDGTATRKARRQALDALRQVGIPELADRFMDQMSGGQQQRVAIARAIAGPDADVELPAVFAGHGSRAGRGHWRHVN